MSLYRLVLIFSALILSLLTGQISAFAATADIIYDRTNQVVDIGSADSIFVYFSYGNPNLAYSIDSTSTLITISNNNLQIDSNNIWDIKNSSQTCSAQNSDKAYQINPNLVLSPTSLLYGPGSADNANQPSGKTNSVLDTGQTGCLKIGLKTSGDNTAGNVEAVMEELRGANAKQWYKSNDIPPIKKVLLYVGTPVNCAATEDIFSGKCIPKCTINTYRDLSGNCKTKELICQSGYEAFDNQCKPACSTGQIRNDLGICKGVEKPQNRIISQLISAGIIIFLFGFIGFLIWKIIRIVTKRRA